MIQTYIQKSTFILSIILLFAVPMHAQYYKASKISEELMIEVNKHNESLGNENDMFSACPQGVSVFGQVFRGTHSVDHGFVFLYSYDSINHTYSFYDATAIKKLISSDVSYYYFDTVPMGEYTTMAVLSSTLPYSDQYAPAYLGNTFYWTQAARFILNAPGYNYPINLSEVEPSNGLSSISGRVLEGTSKSPGDPIANIPLYLIDDNSILRGYTYSNSLGKYSFNSLPYGKYQVYTNLINYQINPSVATTTINDLDKKEINIYIGNGVVTSFEDGSISDIKAIVFPNPTSGNLTLELSLKQEEVLNIKVYNVFGQQVKTCLLNTHFLAGSYSQQIDLSSLSQGVYYLVIEDKSKQYKALKIIRQ
ncbi:MAG: T9SS type A sorting domain-containing protein [Bacteroidales bacterium]|nr:T9SS type A sorting domain-containing protein [Bacteroidales bacterium]